MSIEPLETAEGAEYPGCHQLSVFLENRLGQLLRLVRVLEAESISILGLCVEGTVDCAIVRLLVDQPELARRMFTDAGFAVSESEILVAELPPGQRGIASVAAALIAGEVNINYLYPVWAAGEWHGPCLAIQVDNLVQAVGVLRAKRLRVLSQDEL
ncbi:hypothetical protein RAS1_09540 [Phycisphaerae bacterium RAS1]|nr:hypothetical protein RAS1_09540 [Phycisphaerae bacterium RAS1]